MTTQTRLQELFILDESTGILYNKIDRNSKARKGQIAGCQRKENKTTLAYWTICVDGVYYNRANLVYEYITGEKPKNILDHIDGNSLNDTFSNLRDVTQRQNRYNSRVRIDCSTGVKGICYVAAPREHYRAGVQIKGVRYRRTFTINSDVSKQEALDKAKKWVRNIRQQLHGEFTHHG